MTEQGTQRTNHHVVPQETSKPIQAPQVPRMARETPRGVPLDFSLVRHIYPPSLFSLRRDFLELLDHGLPFKWTVPSPQGL